MRVLNLDAETGALLTRGVEALIKRELLLRPGQSIDERAASAKTVDKAVELKRNLKSPSLRSVAVIIDETGDHPLDHPAIAAIEAACADVFGPDATPSVIVDAIAAHRAMFAHNLVAMAVHGCAIEALVDKAGWIVADKDSAPDHMRANINALDDALQAIRSSAAGDQPTEGQVIDAIARIGRRAPTLVRIYKEGRAA
jgi:hypothetical protein